MEVATGIPLEYAINKESWTCFERSPIDQNELKKSIAILGNPKLVDHTSHQDCIWSRLSALSILIIFMPGIESWELLESDVMFKAIPGDSPKDDKPLFVKRSPISFGVLKGQALLTN